MLGFLFDVGEGTMSHCRILHTGKYCFMMRMVAIFAFSAQHSLLNAWWIGVATIGLRHKLLEQLDTLVLIWCWVASAG